MQLTGILLILASAACFGSMALFAQWTYAESVTPGTLLFLRFGAGALLIGAWVNWRRIPLPRGRALAGYAFLGMLYAAMAWSFFSALQYAGSGLVALLLYTYPLFVALIAAILGLERLGRTEVVAIAIAAGGLLLALGGDTAGSRPLGITLGLASGVIYAVYILVGSRLGDATHPLAAAFVVLLSGAACHGIAGGVGGFAFPTSDSGWLAALAIGIFGAALAIPAFFAGLSRVGPTRASVLSTLEPVVTIVLGVLFLNERLGAAQLFGGFAVLAAAILLVRRQPAATEEAPHPGAALPCRCAPPDSQAS